MCVEFAVDEDDTSGDVCVLRGFEGDLESPIEGGDQYALGRRMVECLRLMPVLRFILGRLVIWGRHDVNW